jgi:hypothetical protein
MYRCGICDVVSRPRDPLIRLVIPKREDPSKIAREVPVCRTCAKQLEAGASHVQLMKAHAPAPPAIETPVAAAPQRKTI